MNFQGWTNCVLDADEMCRVSPSEGGVLRGIPPLTKRLVCPSKSHVLICLQNVDFVIFMQFLVILPELSSYKLTPFGTQHLWGMPDFLGADNLPYEKEKT